MTQYRLRIAQVCLDNGRALAGLQRPRMGQHHRVVVDVDDPGARAGQPLAAGVRSVA